jgi:hypothetical protein
MRFQQPLHIQFIRVYLSKSRYAEKVQTREYVSANEHKFISAMNLGFTA